MIDTVRLDISKSLDPDKLKRKHRWGWDRRGFVDAEGQSHEWECLMPPRKKDDPVEPHYLRYMPDKEVLILEASLPKVVWGQNVSMLSQADLDNALVKLSNNLCDLTGADIPHVKEWELRGRLDCVFSWDTLHAGKSHVSDYMHALKTVEIPRHYTQSVDHEGTLYWRNSQRVIRLYDKQAETGSPDANGLLRFECQLNHAKREMAEPVAPGDKVRKLGRMIVKTPGMKAGDVLNWKTASGVLGKYLDAIGADLVIRDDERLFKHLRETLSNTKAIRLTGYAAVLKMFSRDELIDMGYNRKTLWRYSNEINKSGASLASSKSGLLPPLTLPETYDGRPGRLWEQ